MKKVLFQLFCVSIFSTLSSFDAAAQCFKAPDGTYKQVDGTPCGNTIITAVPFLRIVGDARSGAMGDAGIAISADANSMHFNASKLTFAGQTTGVSATYTPWLRALGLTDVYMAYLSGYTQLDSRQAVGLSLRYFNLGSINFTSEDGASLGTGRPNELEVNLAYSRKLTERFAVGLAAKYIYSNLAAGQSVGTVPISAGNGAAADISMTYKRPITVSGTKSDLTVGLAISNIGTKITYTKSVNRDYLPANLGIGVCWDFHLDQYNSIAATIDVNKLLVPTPQFKLGNPDWDKNRDSIPDYKQQSPIGAAANSFSDAPNGGSEELRELMYSFGMEYWYDKQFALRAGYYHEDRTKGNRKFLTIGLGVKYNIFGLNFSYLVPVTSQRNPLDNTLRFTLLFDFAAIKPESVKEGTNQ